MAWRGEDGDLSDLMDVEEALGEWEEMEAINTIQPGDQSDKAEQVTAALNAAVPGRIPGAEANMQIVRNALVQATHMGQPLSERFRRHMTLAQYEEAVLHFNTEPTAFVDGEYGYPMTLQQLRGHMLEMPMMARVVVRIDHANLLDLRELFASDEERGIAFMVSISVLATVHYWRITSSNTSNTYAVYQHLFGLGDYLFPEDDQSTWEDISIGWQPPEDGSDNPTAIVTTRMPIEITAVPRAKVTEHQARRRYRAGGFKDVILPAVVLETSNDVSLYFPPCKPDQLQDCLLCCVVQALEGDINAMHPAYRDRFITALYGLRKDKKGMTAYSIKNINKILFEYRDRLHVKAFVTHASRGESNTFIELNRDDRASIWGEHLEDGMRNLFIVRIDYSGRFTMQRNFTAVPGGLHYVLLSTLALAKEDFEDLEVQMFDHIGKKHDITFQELFETNARMVEEEKQIMLKERKTKQMQRLKAADRTWDLLVAVCDLECLVERYPGDKLDLDKKELMKVHDNATLAHIPCTFAWGVVNVEKPLDKLWPGEGDMPHTELMARNEADTLCMAVFKDLRPAGERQDGSTSLIARIHEGTEENGYVDCLFDGLQAMFKYMEEEGITYLLALFHNFSKYDGPQMLRHLQPRAPVEGETAIIVDEKSFLKTPRGILRMGYKKGPLRIVMQCTKVHYGDSLENLCESFKLPPSHRKKPWNFDEDFITRTRLKSEDFRSRLLDYGVYDIYSLGLVVCRMEESHRVLFPIHIKDKKPRLAYITYQQFLRAWLEDSKLKLIYAPSMLPDYEAILLKSLRGGLSLAHTREYCSGKWARLAKVDMEDLSDLYEIYPELESIMEEWLEDRGSDMPNLIFADVMHRYPELFQKELKEVYEDPDSLISLDNNSLFPFAQTHPVPIGAGHMLDAQESSELLARMALVDHPREWGIVMCRVTPDSFPKDCPPILSRRREKGQGLLYGNFPSETFEAPFTSHDLLVFSWANASIEVLFGVWWTDDEELSNEYIPVIEELYELKSTAPTEAMKKQAKLATVSIYGTTGYDVQPTKDILQQPGEFTVTDEELIVSDVNSQLSAILPSCNIIHLKARFTHQFGRASNKATITNCILSRSRYHMYRCMRMVAIKRFQNLDVVKAFYAGIRSIHYIDTDSLFLKQDWFPYFEACNLISNRLGDFKNDYGRGVLPFMLAPAAKTRFTEMVKFDPDAPEGEPKYRLDTVLKFKGMPSVKNMTSVSVARSVYMEMIEKFTVALRKQSWKKGLGGVSTSMVDAVTSRESLMRDKKGLRAEVSASGAITIRNLFLGDSLETSVDYPDMTVSSGLHGKDREARLRKVQGDFLAFTIEHRDMRKSAYSRSLSLTAPQIF